MMTNTYTPHTGGVARSVEWFSDALRQLGHRVLVVAPTFNDMPDDEPDVVRVPAIQNFNGSDFSVRLPIPGLLRTAVEECEPDVVHAHHPFLLGDAALRVAALRDVPILFTHHTMYERYTHYVPGDSPAMQRFAIRLATEFSNLCDHVIAPSESIAEVLKDRGVTTEITAIPTGIDRKRFTYGDGRKARSRNGIPPTAFVVGHVGRLASEKNLTFLTRAVGTFLKSRSNAHFLVVGAGPSQEEIHAVCKELGVEARLHHPRGTLDGQQLADAYHAMDVFAFASHSETQGMVLAEALTAGVPVVGVDAPGVREVVRDSVNGRLLPADDVDDFAGALSWLANSTAEKRQALIEQSLNISRDFAMPRCADRLLAVYQQSAERRARHWPRDDTAWAGTVRLLDQQWRIMAGVGSAVGDALFGSSPKFRPH